MYRSIRHFFRQIPGLLIPIIFLIALSGCTSSAAPSPVVEQTVQTNLALIQQNGNLSVKLFAIIDFDYSGVVYRIPSEFVVSGVPLIWMGANFNGKLQNTSGGQVITDEVHGSLSSDGNWVESSYYSRQITRTNGSGTFYRVTLRNVPVSEQPNGSPVSLGSFERSGADIQKFIAKIEYQDGIIKNGQIDTGIKYISTDWKNNSAGQIPSLKLIFAKGRGNAGQNTKPGM